MVMNGGLLLLYEKEDKIQMIERLDDTRINELTEAIIIDYLKTKGQVPESIVCVDIEGLASEYFGFNIVYDNFAEDNPNRIAFCANGVKPIKVFRNKKPTSIVYPDNTIVLDKYLLKVENSTSRRFSIGHELGHKILSRVTAEHHSGRYNSMFDNEMTYTIDEMRMQFSICEIEANKVSAALLLPKFLLENTLIRTIEKDKFTVYGEYQMLPDDSYKFKEMAEDLGVSPVTLQIRLKNCKMLEYKDMSEYLKITKLKGDAANV